MGTDLVPCTMVNAVQYLHIAILMPQQCNFVTTLQVQALGLDLDAGFIADTITSADGTLSNDQRIQVAIAANDIFGATVQ